MSYIELVGVNMVKYNLELESYIENISDVLAHVQYI